MGMTINFLGNGNGNGNCNMGMGGNGIQKSIPADLYLEPRLTDHRSRQRVPQRYRLRHRGRLNVGFWFLKFLHEYYKYRRHTRYMLRGVWQALNCLSIHSTYCVIVAGASPGETKMWAAVRENRDFLQLRF